MTTIVYRDGLMAGDGRETSWEKGESTFIIRDDCVKIHRLPDGRLFGAARTSEDINVLHDALVAACDPEARNKWPNPKVEDINAMVIDTDGSIHVYEGARWEKVDMPYYSVGSGSRYAFPALFVGADARRAVEAGMRFDPYSGGKVTTLSLKQPRS
jgi:hypothetical protein